MSRAEVRKLKGAPDDRERGPDFVTWIHRRPRIGVTSKPRVIAPSTNSRRIRVPHDIGIGTSKGDSSA